MVNIKNKGKKQRSKKAKGKVNIEDIVDKFKYTNFTEMIEDGI